MSNPAPPWCLQWDVDGELDRADRDDLEQLLPGRDSDRIRFLLSQVFIKGSSSSTSSVIQLQ
jgi:hypothetical protein